MSTFFKPDQIWQLWAIMLLLTAAAIALEKRYLWAKKITGAILGLLGAALLTNLRIIPMESPVYDAIWGYVVPLSIPMLLFKSDLRRIFSESGRLLVLFLIGAVGTILGALLAYTLLAGSIPELGKITGIMTGSYIGGGVNFAAMSSTFHVSGTMVSAATVADNFNMALYFIILLGIPRLAFFRKHYKTPYVDHVEEHGIQAVEEKKDARPTTTYDIALSFAIACAIVAASKSLAGLLGSLIPTEGAMGLVNQLLSNDFLIITTLSMILATAFPGFFSHLVGADELGNFLIYIFCVVIGVPASIPVIVKTAPLLLVFCFIMVVVNMLVVFVAGKLLKFPLEEAIIASNANIGGPATASAMAISQGWNALIGPGIFAGLLGYVIGNYCGIFVGNLLL